MTIEIEGKKVFTAIEAAKRLGITPNTATKWLRSGQLRGIKRGKSWYVPETAIAEYIGLDGATNVLET